jgi:uncharacterized protein YjbJ (UPF0337 family)
MGGKTDQVKDQGKEEIGDLTGDRDLDSGGRVDHPAGKVEERLDLAKAKADGVIGQVRDVLHRT